MKGPFRAIAEFTYDWESWINAEGKLLWVNASVERLTGYSVQECMTMADYPLTMVYGPDQPAVAAVLLQAQQGQTGNHFEFRVAHKDGSVRWAAISWQPISVDGKAEGFRSSVRDIDERKRMEQELQAAMRRAEQANYAKTQFLANVTHELRTPLQSIIGYGQLLLGSGIQEPLRGYAETMLQQSEHLEHLVSDLLDFAALQAGMLTVRTEAFEPSAAITRVVLSMQPLALKRGLVLESEAKVRGVMMGDPHRFAQVLSNLISNAIKYTPSGRVRVTASPSRNPSRITICVDDTGPGLPSGAQVFEPFRQGPESQAYRGGVGLGLALSRQLCVRMGGSLEATVSELGGARLVVTLPLASKASARGVAHFEPSDVRSVLTTSFAHQHPLAVLVIDDVEPAREFLVAALRALGYAPHAAGSADQAFKIVDRHPVDLALLDIQMPEVDGWTTARGLRARLGEEPYLVALTAQSSADDATLLTTAGFDGFAGKPIKMAALQELLIQASQRKRRRAQTDESVFDPVRWTELAGITTATGEILLQVMCKRVADALPDLKRRIEAASEEQNRVVLNRAIHEANGLFGLIGAMAARALFDECERQSEQQLLTPDLVARLVQATDVVLRELAVHAATPKP